MGLKRRGGMINTRGAGVKCGCADLTRAPTRRDRGAERVGSRLCSRPRNFFIGINLEIACFNVFNVYVRV